MVFRLGCSGYLGFPKIWIEFAHIFNFLSVLGKYSTHMLMFSWLFHHFVEDVQLKQAPVLSNQILFFTTPTEFT